MNILSLRLWWEHKKWKAKWNGILCQNSIPACYEHLAFITRNVYCNFVFKVCTFHLGGDLRAIFLSSFYLFKIFHFTLLIQFSKEKNNKRFKKSTVLSTL